MFISLCVFVWFIVSAEKPRGRELPAAAAAATSDKPKKWRRAAGVPRLLTGGEAGPES